MEVLNYKELGLKRERLLRAQTVNFNKDLVLLYYTNTVFNRTTGKENIYNIVTRKFIFDPWIKSEDPTFVLKNRENAIFHVFLYYRLNIIVKDEHTNIWTVL